MRRRSPLTRTRRRSSGKPETGTSEGNALNNLGLALRDVGRFEEAITAHRTRPAIFREIGDRHSEGTALNSLGLALWRSDGLRRRSSPIRTHAPSSGRPATGTVRAWR